MAIRALTVPIYSSHFPTFAAGGVIRSRISARTRVNLLSAIVGFPLLRQLPRSSFSDQPHIQGICSQTMADTSRTVPSIAVFVTVPNREEGRKLAHGIIQDKLAACINRVPGIESIYWWHEKVEMDQEELLIIKTRESLLEALTTYIKANHPYEVPEIISLPITGGNEDYLKWLKDNTKE